MDSTIKILDKKVKSILGNDYDITLKNGKLDIRFANYKITSSHLISEIERKSGEATKKEIVKLCLMIALEKLCLMTALEKPIS